MDILLCSLIPWLSVKPGPDREPMLCAFASILALGFGYLRFSNLLKNGEWVWNSMGVPDFFYRHMADFQHVHWRVHSFEMGKAMESYCSWVLNLFNLHVFQPTIRFLSDQDKQRKNLTPTKKKPWKSMMIRIHFHTFRMCERHQCSSSVHRRTHRTVVWDTINLVGGLEHVFFPYIGNFIIPTDFHSIIF